MEAEIAQNTSHAVMAQRSEPHNSLDDFPTPPWATRAFLEWLDPDPSHTVWEPAANRGYMVRPLREHFLHVQASDVHDYDAGFEMHDFLMPGEPLCRPHWVITNPPFRLAAEFVLRALDIAEIGVAVIVRSVWSESAQRYKSLFQPHPPTAIVQHVERVPMVRGRYDPSASTATGYAWFVWDKQKAGQKTHFDWLPPARARLYREGDNREEKA